MQVKVLAVAGDGVQAGQQDGGPWGGVASAQDVVDMVACGARDVALGTALFADPDAPRRIRYELSGVDFEGVFARAHVATSPRVVAV